MVLLEVQLEWTVRVRSDCWTAHGDRVQKAWPAARDAGGWVEAAGVADAAAGVTVVMPEPDGSCRGGGGVDSSTGSAEAEAASVVGCAAWPASASMSGAT